MLKSTFRSQTPGVREWRGLSWLRAAERVLFSRPAGALSALLTTLIIFGCMSTNHYHTTEEVRVAPAGEGSESQATALVQSGKITFKAGTMQVIYYPIPYASPPNLELDDAEYFDLLEQKDKFFRIRCHTNSDYEKFTSHWKARGLPIPPPPGPPPEPATLLPPAAVKISGPDSPPPPPVPYGSEPK